MSCPAPEWKRRIPFYEAGLLEPAEAARLECHLLECPECSLDVFGMQPVIERLRERDDLAAGRAPAPFFQRHRWLAAAAVLVAAAALTCGLYLYLPRSLPAPPASPSADISRVFHEVDFSQLRPPLADRSPLPLYQQALQRFETGDCRACLELLAPVLARDPADPASVLLAARCRLGLGETAGALDLLTRCPVGRDAVYYHEYLWLKAEGLLGTGRKAEARALLEELAGSPGPYQAKAGRLLELLP